MDRRTRILVSVFAAFAAIWLVSSLVYPKWVEPLVTIKERVAAAQSELDKLNEAEAKVDQAKFAYKQFLERCGSWDAAKIENGLRERLNKLIAAHQLDEMNVSGGISRISSFGKTVARKMTLSVDATGTLEGAIGFLKSVSEMPHLARVGNVSIYPSQESRRKRKGKRVERVQMRVPIEVLVLPQHKMLGRKLTEEELRQPDQVVRHEELNYRRIWEKTPFTEYIELEPMIVSAGDDVTAQVGKRGIMLNGTAKGGDGEYTIKWTPSDYLSDPGSLRPRIDTKEPFELIYTLSVSDTSENSGTAQVKVTIVAKEEQVVERKDPPKTAPKKPLGPQRWKDGRQQQLIMSTASRNGDYRRAAIMVHHTRTKATAHYRPGDEFDGGELLFVHPRGAIVRRQSDLFVYPLGLNASDDVKADDADDHPKLQRVAMLIQQALDEQEAEKAGDTGNGEPNEAGSKDAPPTGREPGAAVAPAMQLGGPMAKPGETTNAKKAAGGVPPAESQGRDGKPPVARPDGGSAPTTAKGPPPEKTGAATDRAKGAVEQDGSATGPAPKATPPAKPGTRNTKQVKPAPKGKTKRTLKSRPSRRKGSATKYRKK